MFRTDKEVSWALLVTVKFPGAQSTFDRKDRSVVDTDETCIFCAAYTTFTGKPSNR
jgi:hypothetical protein